jgi:F0F1-type ATP synthase epsilon subunit
MALMGGFAKIDKDKITVLVNKREMFTSISKRPRKLLE